MTGTSAGLPEGLTISHDEDETHHRLTARHEGEDVGFLTWHKDHPPRYEGEPETPGLVSDIEVHPDYYHRGIATALWHEAQKYVPAPVHSDHLTGPGEGWVGSLEAAARWQPSSGIFAPTTGLDPRLFDDQGSLRPAVREAIMERLDRCIRTDTQIAGSEWQQWLHVYIAGGSASEWAGDRPNDAAQDLDVLTGADFAKARYETDELKPLSDDQIAAALNAAFRGAFNETAATLPGVEGTWDLTAYCNPAIGSDIRAIKPYAAYDLTDGRWTVKPPHLPEHSLADFDPAVLAHARAVLAQARAILRMPEPLRTREARDLWQHVHEHRCQAFSDEGEGWTDPGNLDEKWLAYAPGNVLGRVRELALAPKTASAADGTDVWWHGTPDERTWQHGAAYGIHIGTEEAARQALNAHIGKPHEGEWDGTREYGKTLLDMTTRSWGLNGEEYVQHQEPSYPSGKATYSGGEPIPMDARPNVFPVRIKGPMTNTLQRPHEDFHANGYMHGQIKRGRARRGYYYKNVSEDEGSISAVVPSAAHLERIEHEPKTAAAEPWGGDPWNYREPEPEQVPLEDLHGVASMNHPGYTIGEVWENFHPEDEARRYHGDEEKAGAAREQAQLRDYAERNGTIPGSLVTCKHGVALEDGEHRYMAARDAGLESVPVLRARSCLMPELHQFHRPRTAALQPGESQLETREYEGEYGNKDHITRSDYGMIPTSAIANMPGANGEVPGEHTTRDDARWEDLKGQLDREGIQHQIFITKDWDEEPKISEDSNRRDWAVLRGVSHVPAEIRYFGHAERQGLVHELMPKTAAHVPADEPFVRDRNDLSWGNEEWAAARREPWHAAAQLAQQEVRNSHPRLTMQLPRYDEADSMAQHVLRRAGYPAELADNAFVSRHPDPQARTSNPSWLGGRRGVTLHPDRWDYGTMAHEFAHHLVMHNHAIGPNEPQPDEQVHGPEWARAYARGLNAISPKAGDDFLYHHQRFRDMISEGLQWRRPRDLDAADERHRTMLREGATERPVSLEPAADAPTKLASAVNEEQPDDYYYHVSPHRLSRGTMLQPGVHGRGNFDESTGTHVHMTKDLDRAEQYRYMLWEQGHPEQHLYEVRAHGPVEPDPADSQAVRSAHPVSVDWSMDPDVTESDWFEPKSGSHTAVKGYDLSPRSGMIYLELPEGTVRQVPGGVDDHHVTLVYLGSDVDDEAFAEACRRAEQAAAQTPPLKGILRGVDSFEPSDGSDQKVPAFVPAYIPGIGKLRRLLEDLSGSEHTQYRPHVTLAYLEPGDELPEPHPKRDVQFDRLHVKRGDDVVSFPLGRSQGG